MGLLSLLQDATAWQKIRRASAPHIARPQATTSQRLSELYCVTSGPRLNSRRRSTGLAFRPCTKRRYNGVRHAHLFICRQGLCLAPGMGRLYAALSTRSCPAILVLGRAQSHVRMGAPAHSGNGRGPYPRCRSSPFSTTGLRTAEHCLRPQGATRGSGCIT
jgi:hypothetical protein